MKFVSTIIGLAALSSVTVATTVEPIFANNFYDNAKQSLNNVACSGGPNGLVTKGFTTFDSLPTFPNIGGVYAVHNFNSIECGSCWQLTYKDTGATIHVIAIDTIYSGFDISEAAVKTLTNGKPGSTFNVHSKQVDRSHCGL